MDSHRTTYYNKNTFRQAETAPAAARREEDGLTHLSRLTIPTSGVAWVSAARGELYFGALFLSRPP